MPDTLVGVPFAKQEKTFYCGPATLQMMLSALGVAAPATPPSWQDQLWEQIKNNTGATRPSGATTQPSFPSQKCEWCTTFWNCWSTTPAVLERLLNSLQATAQYSIIQNGSEEDATGVIMNTLDANVPAVALVRGWKHWLIVDGYRHDEYNPTPIAGRQLNGVYLRDPNAKTTHYVAWKRWCHDYMQFVGCGEFRDSIVVMNGTRRALPPPPPPPPSLPQPPGPQYVRGLPAEAPMLKLLPVSAIVEKAGIEARQFSNSARMAEAFAGARAQEALLVQRLDERDSYYYIVGLRGDKGETARMMMDAFDGSLLEVSSAESGGEALAPFVTPAAMFDRLQSESARLADSLRFLIRSQSVGQHPVLVWMPCAESSSPFLPFYQYSIGNSFLYYRVDGERFEELSTGPA